MDRVRLKTEEELADGKLEDLAVHIYCEERGLSNNYPAGLSLHNPRTSKNGLSTHAAGQQRQRRHQNGERKPRASYQDRVHETDNAEDPRVMHWMKEVRVMRDEDPVLDISESAGVWRNGPMTTRDSMGGLRLAKGTETGHSRQTRSVSNMTVDHEPLTQSCLNQSKSQAAREYKTRGDSQLTGPSRTPELGDYEKFDVSGTPAKNTQHPKPMKHGRQGNEGDHIMWDLLMQSLDSPQAKPKVATMGDPVPNHAANEGKDNCSLTFESLG